MKVKFLFAALLASSLIFSGCGKDDDDKVDPNTNNPATTSSLTAKVDGTDWTSGTSMVSTANSRITLNGSNATSQTMSISVPGSSTGTFTDSDVLVSYSEGGSAMWSNMMSGTASVTVTKLDMTAKKASGTFSFTAEPVSGGATGTKTVTNGVFTDVAIH